jgi:serine/threonine protein kinase/Flp pilus assembly protein TadD
MATATSGTGARRTGSRQLGLHHPETGELIAGRYKVLNKIGQGGMGDVYLGFDMRTNAHVAIKVLHEELAIQPDLVQRFRTEAVVINRIGSDGIASILDCSQENDTLKFIVLEYLQGPTLHQVLGEPPRPLHMQRIRRITLQILNILAAAHEQGVIHRDLKPENVFVLRRGPRDDDVVKIIDWGIAKFMPSMAPAGQPGLTQVGLVIGTPYYMSPEQCKASGLDQRTDIYAAGIMLYEMATGRLPFGGASNVEIMSAHLQQTPERPSNLNGEITPALEEVIDRALQKRPEHRFQTAADFADALEEAIPEDRKFYRGNRASSPVTPLASPLVEAPPAEAAAAPEAAPSPRLLPVEPRVSRDPPPDASATPTNLLKAAGEPAAKDIGLAKTITPTDLDREAGILAEAIAAATEEAAPAEPEAAKEALPPAAISTPDITLPPIGGASPETRTGGRQVPFDAAVAYAKQCGVWIGKIPRRTQIFILAAAVATALVAAVITTAARGCHSSNTAADAGRITETTVAETETEIFVPQTKQPDVPAIRVPVPVFLEVPPADATAETADEATTAEPAEQVDYAAEVSTPDVPEILPETAPVAPPDGYEELLARAQAARNWRTAVAKLEEATRLWPEGPGAWEALGDILVTQRGQTERARNAYARCLELLPPSALSRRAVVEGKLRGLH